jgi:hypothetical protein
MVTIVGCPCSSGKVPFFSSLVLTAGYAQRKPCFDSGSERIRCPVAAKIALHTAGKIGGNAGSPSPVGEFLDFTK